MTSRQRGSILSSGRAAGSLRLPCLCRYQRRADQCGLASSPCVAVSLSLSLAVAEAPLEAGKRRYVWFSRSSSRSPPR